jgi:hypothetical protein
MSDILDNFRQSHPLYKGVSDADLAKGLYRYRDQSGFSYADHMTPLDFSKKVGAPSMLAPPPGYTPEHPPLGFAPPNDQGSPSSEMGGTEAALSGALRGVPIVGPSLESSAGWLGSALHSWLSGDDIKKTHELGALAQANTNAAHPVARKAGEIGGGITGYGALAATAPELMFGSPGASMGTKILTGMASGGGLGTADEAARELHDTGKVDPGQLVNAFAAGGSMGALAGPFGKAAGAIARPIARTFSNWFSPAVPGMRKSAANALAEALTSDSAINNPVQTLQKLGPEGSLADVGPATQGWAQGVTALKATPGGRGRSLVFGALNKRDDMSLKRVLGALDTEFGQAGNSPLKEQRLNRDQAKIEGQTLPAIFSGSSPVDIGAVLATVGQRLKTAVGPEAKALETARDWLMKNITDPRTQQVKRVPINDAQTLHNAKDAIDNLINYGNEGLGIPAGAVNKEQGALKLVRGQLNQALRDQVPDYADTMDKLSALREEAKQIKAGNEIFKGGNEPIHPQDLTEELANLSPEAAAAKRFGARAAIDRRIRTNPNDRLALKGVVGDPEDFKRQNLSAIFGSPQTENVANRAEAEKTMFGTKSNVVDNSQTEPRQEAVKMANPEMASHGIGLGVAALHPEAAIPYAGLKGAEAGIKAANRAFSRRRNMDIARALLPRSDAANLAQALLAHGARREAAGQPTAKAVSDMARALLGYEGTVRRAQDRPSLESVGRAAVGVPAAVLQLLR